MAKDALGEIFTEKRGGRLVAVRRLIVGRNAVEGIMAEVSAAMKLKSPLILKPIDASADGGLVTIVTETVEGRTLRGLLTTLGTTGEKLPISHATWIAMKVLEALEHAHALMDGTVPHPAFHGRVSPEHIVLTPIGQVRLTGFGLDAACRHLLKGPQKTDPTFAYVAPEQLVEGSELNSASDNFAVGAVLAEALTGKSVFLEGTFAATWEAINTRSPPMLKTAREGVPKALDEAVTWALERSDSRRCARPEALRTRLEAFQGMLDVGDRIRPDEHPKRLADLMRLRIKAPMGAATVDVTSMEPISTAAPVEEPKAAKPRRGALRVLKLLFAALMVFFSLGVWARWPELEVPLRQKIPYGVAVQLGIEYGPPPVVDLPDASVEEPDAGEPDAGEPVDAGPPPLKPALVSIESTPKGAEVLLDGKVIGKTPLESVEIEPGEHTLELVSKKPKLKLSQKLQLGEGETKKLQLKLKKK